MPDQIALLIESCKKGNQIAQMQIYDTYSKAMYTIACRYLKNEENAKDVMQEGFLKAFQNINNYKPKSSFGAWLKRIIINQCLDTLRKKELVFTQEDVDHLMIIDEDNWDFNTTITKADILNAIELLNHKQKTIVKLYLIDGYDHKEISEILNIPIKTSRTNLHRGKLKLKELLKPKYNEARY